MQGAIGNCDIVLYSSKGTARLTEWQCHPASAQKAQPHMAAMPFVNWLNNSGTLPGDGSPHTGPGHMVT